MSIQLSQLQCRKKDLELRMENFERDYENDDSLTEAQKETAFKVLQQDHKTLLRDLEIYEAREGTTHMSKLVTDSGNAGNQPSVVSTKKLGRRLIRLHIGQFV